MKRGEVVLSGTLNEVKGGVEGQKKWYVYILQCKKNILYTGITKDLNRRFKEHKNKSSHFTRYNPPSKIIFTECFCNKSVAAKREA